ncbi:MAG TPA: outer membrane beta-barrel protein [Candidatus Tripitaka sp. YC43]
MRLVSLVLIACFVFFLGAVRVNWVGAEELSKEEVAALKDLLKTKPGAELSAEDVGALKELLKAREIPPMPAKAPAAQLNDEEITGIRDFFNVFKGVKFSGFVESFYQYNSVNPGHDKGTGPSGRRGSTPTFVRPNFLEVRGFDREDNSFTLNNIELHLYKEPTEDSPIGFRITTLYGEQAQRLTFVPTDGRVDGGDNNNFTVGEGYTWWRIPLGKGVDFKFGKFATWIGAEVWESPWNPNFSRSLLYQNAIPFTHTGLSLGYPVLDNLYFTFFLVNGWDTFIDNNRSKTFGSQTKYTIPNMPILHNAFVLLNTSHGPVQRDKVSSTLVRTDATTFTHQRGAESNWRHFLDFIIQFEPTTWLRSNTNFDYGTEEFKRGTAGGFGTLVDVGDGRRNRKWWGAAQIFHFFPQNRINFALRGEYFWDKDQARNVVIVPANHPTASMRGVSIAEGTATLNIKIRDKLVIRPEVRHDRIIGASGRGSTDQFDNHDNNTTFATALTYEF